MLSRNVASVRVRAPIMRRSWIEIFATSALGEKPEAGSFVHDMF
jgi:hypothetical protein